MTDDVGKGRNKQIRNRANLWEAREDESSKAFQAFVVFRNMGYDRTISKAARELKKAPSVLHRWSQRYEWVRRVEAWDAEQDRLWTLELKHRRRAMAERHAKSAQKLQDVAIAAIQKVFGKALKKLQEDGDAEMKPSDILRFLTEGAKMERVALGEPSEIIEEQVTGGLVDERDRKPFVPLTFSGRIEQAVGLLETARERAAVKGAEQSD